jgi:Na+-translocating ferredoxin:NAD+ oxidoreductase subunit C
MKVSPALFSFQGGIHPPDAKTETAALPLRALPLPARLVVSMAQHLGAPSAPCVKAGDRVRAGQMIAKASGFISAAVHAPAAGTVAAIQEAPTPTGRSAMAIIIETDPGEPAADPPYPPMPAWRNEEPRNLVERIAAAGIVGMGGAGFPTHIKLSPPGDKPIDTVILNGAECEPFLNSDNRLMIERAAQIWEGCQIIRHILGAATLCVAIEDNKAEAAAALFAAMKETPGDNQIHILKTRYPQGSEKQQIFSVTGRTVPMGGLPMDVGCVVENAGTADAIRDAVVNGRPLTARAITVSGDAVNKPANWLAPVGAVFADLAQASGGYRANLAKLIAGGPMMGFALPSLDVAMGKTSSGLLLFSSARLSPYRSLACINCGRCVEACPLRLMPTELSQAIEADDIDEAEKRHVMDCFECGACAYVCPARRPLVQHMRRAKAIIAQRRRAAQRQKK